MAIAPGGLGVGTGSVWMGSRDASTVGSLALWVTAVVAYNHAGGKSTIYYPLNRDQTISMRDRLLVLSEPKPKPKTAGERYARRKEQLGLSFKFDEESDGIFVADRAASPDKIPPHAVGSISFKSGTLDGVFCVPLEAEHCAAFAKVLSEVLDLFVEPS